MKIIEDKDIADVMNDKVVSNMSRWYGNSGCESAGDGADEEAYRNRLCINADIINAKIAEALDFDREKRLLEACENVVNAKETTDRLSRAVENVLGFPITDDMLKS